MEFIAGIDIGSSAVKAVIILRQLEQSDPASAGPSMVGCSRFGGTNNRSIDPNARIIGRGLAKSGADLKDASQKAFNQAREDANAQIPDSGPQIRIITTGFGRTSFPGAHQSITEISAHARGVYQYFPRAVTIIDIGGQDNKVIRLDSAGHILNFRMNRKCAAGTGAFLEEIAYKMDIPLAQLNTLAKLSTKPIELGSYCTVFTATEILSKIREGINKEDIIHGVFKSIIKRIIEMDPMGSDVVLTGGVIAYNDVIKEMLAKTLGREVLVPQDPQYTGALGAALFGTTHSPATAGSV